MNGIPPMPRRVKKLPLTAARKVRMRNRLSASKGNGVFAACKSIACQQQDGNRQQPQDLAHAQRMFAEYLQHIGQQRDAGAEEDEAHEIERIRTFRDSPADADRPCTNR